MISLTKNEREALLVLFKDIYGQHNASSIGRLLNISRIGAMKMLKRMEKQGLLKSGKVGNSLIYKLNLDDDYSGKLVSFLMADEANNFKRWKEEFKKLFKNGRIVILFGSTVRNYTQARDIDILVTIEKEDFDEVNALIDERQRILPKRIHPLIMTKDDLLNNLRENKGAMREIAKTGVILYGHDSYVEAVKNVAGI